MNSSHKKSNQSMLLSAGKQELFIGGLNPLTSKIELQIGLREVANFTSLILIYDRATGMNKGYAFVTPLTNEDAQRLTTTTIRIGGRDLLCQYRQGTRSFNSQRRVFVGGLPKIQLTNDEIRNAFEVFGQVRSAYPITCNNGISKGYGFVDFFDSESVYKAIHSSRNFYIAGFSVEIKAFANSKSGSISKRFNSHKIQKNALDCNQTNFIYSQQPGFKLLHFIPQMQAFSKQILNEKKCDDTNKQMLRGSSEIISFSADRRTLTKVILKSDKLYIDSKNYRNNYPPF